MSLAGCFESLWHGGETIETVTRGVMSNSKAVVCARAAFPIWRARTVSGFMRDSCRKQAFRSKPSEPVFSPLPVLSPPLASPRRFAVVPILRHGRPSPWANTESSRIIVAEASLPDLDHCKLTDSTASARQPRAASTSTPSTNSSPGICSEPRLAFNRIVVVRYRMFLESRHLAANTINQQLAAVRRLAHEAAAAGLLNPELAAGIFCQAMSARRPSAHVSREGMSRA